MKPSSCRWIVCKCTQINCTRVHVQQHSYLVLMESVLKAVEVPRRCIYRIWGNFSVFGSGSKESTQFRDFKANPGSLHFTATKLTPKGLSTQSTLESRVYERRERSIFLLPSLFCHQNKASNCSIHTETSSSQPTQLAMN